MVCRFPTPDKPQPPAEGASPLMEKRRPDLPVEPTSPGRYPTDMESRVAVLEQSARATTASLERIERRMDMNAAELRAEHRSDFRWLLGTMLGGFGALLGAMAHGFHWL